MLGQGGCGKDGKDAHLEHLLLSEKPDEARAGMNMVDERYRYRMGRYLRSNFPGLSAQEIADIWEGALEALLWRIQTKKFRATGSVSGLLVQIVFWDAVDCLRKNRGRFVHRDDLDTFVGVPFHDLDGLEHLLAVIEKCLQSLPVDQEIVLRAYVRLVCEGHASKTGKLPLSLLTEEVKLLLRSKSSTQNKVRCPTSMSKRRVRLLFRKARKTLRNHLLNERSSDD